MTIRDLIKYKISVDAYFNWNIFAFKYTSLKYYLVLNKEAVDLKQFGKYHSYVTNPHDLKPMYNDKTFLEDILK